MEILIKFVKSGTDLSQSENESEFKPLTGVCLDEDETGKGDYISEALSLDIVPYYNYFISGQQTLLINGCIGLNQNIKSSTPNSKVSKKE